MVYPMKLTVRVIVTLAALLFLATAADKPEPADLVSNFYADYIRYPHSGLLSAGELERIRPYLSDHLHGLFAAAIRYQQDWIRRNPDEPARDGRPAVINKPPLVEGGDWFASLYEWPDGVRSLTGDEPEESFEVVSTVRRSRNVWHVRVRYSYATEPTVTWEDVFVVIRQRGRLVIDDVIYAGAPNYRRGRLSGFISGPWK